MIINIINSISNNSQLQLLNQTLSNNNGSVNFIFT